MTKIEWTDKTWNPIVGCSVASPGCTNCYAMRMAARLAAMAGDGLDENGYGVRGLNPLGHYRGTTRRTKAGPVWTGKVALAHDGILTAPLRWKKPIRIFVNSMGDLFHESVPDEWIDRVFAVMALCQQHTFQCLTKHSKRMRDYVDEVRRNWCGTSEKNGSERIRASMCKINGVYADDHLTGVDQWPLPNVWLGVSAEDQRRADERIPDLLATPAAVRFLSCEPLLGAINLEYPLSLFPDEPATCCSGHDCGCMGQPIDPPLIYGINWVICGGESGPGARPMHPDWARGLRDQCATSGVPFFFKQHGEFEAAIDRDRDDPDWRRDYTNEFADSGACRWMNLDGGRGFHGERFHVMRRVGKKHTGRLLDGQEHNGVVGNDIPTPIQPDEVAA